MGRYKGKGGLLSSRRYIGGKGFVFLGRYKGRDVNLLAKGRSAKLLV